MLMKVLFELLMKFLQEILKLDPAKVTMADMRKHLDSKRFRVFAAKHD